MLTDVLCVSALARMLSCQFQQARAGLETSDVNEGLGLKGLGLENLRCTRTQRPFAWSKYSCSSPHCFFNFVRVFAPVDLHIQKRVHAEARSLVRELAREHQRRGRPRARRARGRSGALWRRHKLPAHPIVHRLCAHPIVHRQGGKRLRERGHRCWVGMGGMGWDACCCLLLAGCLV